MISSSICDDGHEESVKDEEDEGEESDEDDGDGDEEDLHEDGLNDDCAGGDRIDRAIEDDAALGSGRRAVGVSFALHCEVLTPERPQRSFTRDPHSNVDEGALSSKGLSAKGSLEPSSSAQSSPVFTKSTLLEKVGIGDNLTPSRRGQVLLQLDSKSMEDVWTEIGKRDPSEADLQSPMLRPQSFDSEAVTPRVCKDPPHSFDSKGPGQVQPLIDDLLEEEDLDLMALEIASPDERIASIRRERQGIAWNTERVGVAGNATLRALALDYSVMLEHMQNILSLPDVQPAPEEGRDAGTAATPDVVPCTFNLTEDCLFTATGGKMAATADYELLLEHMEEALLLPSREGAEKGHEGEGEGDEEDPDEFEEEEEEESADVEAEAYLDEKSDKIAEGSSDCHEDFEQRVADELSIENVDEEHEEGLHASFLRSPSPLPRPVVDPFHDTTHMRLEKPVAAAVETNSRVAEQEADAFQLTAPPEMDCAEDVQQRVDLLRNLLVRSMGERRLTEALQFLENIHLHGSDSAEEDEDDDALIDRIELIVGTENLSQLDTMYQLLALEAELCSS